MVPKRKYKGKHPLQLAFKLQWTPLANPSSSRDYFKQNIAGWEEFQPKCLIEFVSKEEAKWGRGSCSACVEQFWQPPVWTTWVLLCFGARTWRLAGGCICTLHVISVQTHPNLALLEVFWAGMGGEEEQKSLLTSYKLCSVRDQQAGHPERLILSTTAVWKA